ncbi:hypothetical protein Q6300_28855, partial [Klebsiella pneumoniae]|uniref:hypothetical protein n=1 Tax=Klebsiella pneumoniae TaxID=573 RepID=UPI00272F7C77
MKNECVILSLKVIRIFFVFICGVCFPVGAFFGQMGFVGGFGFFKGSGFYVEGGVLHVGDPHGA